MPDRLDLEDELVALGRALVIEPPPDDLADAVLARLGRPLRVTPDDERAATPPEPQGVGSTTGLPGPRTTRPGRRRLAWSVAAAVVLVLALIPPVRAAVLELLRIGGVIVREEPRPTTGTDTVTGLGPSTGTRGPSGVTVSLDRAEQLLGAQIQVPAALGPPTSVVVAHEGRVAELEWERPNGTTRLDVFAGSLSWGFLKTVWEAVTPVRVAAYEGVWLGAPHLIEWIDRDGRTHPEPARLAGPTLVWVVPTAAGEVTYRLEGRATLADAVRVAESAR